MTRRTYLFFLCACLLLSQSAFASAIDCYPYPDTSGFTGETTISSQAQVSVGHGDWTWLVSDSEIVCLDTRDPDAPASVGSVPFVSEPQDGLWVDDQLIIAYAYNKLVMFDVSTPEAPVWIRTVSLTALPLDLAYNNGLLLVATDTAGLVIYDISGPGGPTFLASYETGDPANGVCFTSDTTALVTAYFDIREIDLATPELPVELARYSPVSDETFGAFYWDIDVVAGRVIATITDLMPVKNDTPAAAEVRDWDSPTTFLLFDGLVPSQEHRIGYWHGWNISWDEPLEIGDIRGDWVVLNFEDLVVGFDTQQDLPQPSALKSSIAFYAGNVVTSMAFSDATLSIATEGVKVKTMSGSVPSTVPAITMFAEGQSVRLLDAPWAYSYTPGSGYPSHYKYYLWDLRDVFSPDVVDSTSCNNHPDWYIHRKILTTSGDRLLEANTYYGGDQAWRLLDYSVSPMTSAAILPPREEARFCGDLLVTAGDDVMDVFDISNPATPVVRGTLPLAGDPRLSLALQDRVLWSCYDSPNRTLYSVDLSNPDQPQITGSLALSQRLYQLVPFGDLVLALDSAGWVLILDPVTLTIQSTYNSAGQIHRLAVRDDQVWVAWKGTNLVALDLSNLLNPTPLLPGAAVPGPIAAIEFESHIAYIACGAPGVHVVDVELPSAPFYVGGGGLPASSLMVLDYHPVIPNAVLWPDCSISTPVLEPTLPRSGLQRITAAPNPFNGHTVLQMAANVPDGPQAVEIYDVQGRRIAELVVHVVNGSGEVDWFGIDKQGRCVSSGVYFARTPGLTSSVPGRLVYLK